ncbi:YbcC family protein [Azohydromonas caseinilytica]|uniref:Probable inorganic carbon transporter subunit DabA n=1 Tax=Azohydromonas caseinilytica TaxID=2728836 RepID=A0A848FC83_9BURK|nr:DUF2309 domain-containing protein [Azohydromonas caseinilytica]NML16365.1 DUF2309 domain-containing protein [Azohydromonas caseinilytica]
MDAAASQHLLQQADALARHVATACGRIAPSWPLDQFIAVNPYQGWTRHPVARAAAELGALCGTRLTMPRDWYRAQWDAGRLRREHLRAAVERGDGGLDVEELLQALHAPCLDIRHLPLLTDLCDALHPQAPLPWSELVTHQVSQHCAAFFDRSQARWRLATDEDLYGSWRRQLAEDRGIPWRRGRRWAVARLAALSADALTLIGDALAALRVPDAGQAAYLSALLLSLNGWAAWCAYLRWQARLRGSDDTHLQQLLAVRLAWEWLLREDQLQPHDSAEWAAAWARIDHHVARLAAEQRIDWRLQEAMEIAYQQPLCEGLLTAPEPVGGPVAVQAVFCIDVRSEVFRRAFESLSPGLQTRGFAGFFGLPIAYAPVGSEMVRLQLPGLLAPVHTVSEDAEAPSLARAWRQRRQAVLRWRQRWAELRGAPGSGFSFVESCGLLYGAKLLANSLPATTPPRRWQDAGLPREAQGRRPRLALVDSDPAAAARLGAKVLKAMGLTRDFAPLVLLVGHGSQSANNAHAAGLDCGACGGQSGEVNARVLADLLNAGAVREALREQHGLHIPDGTHFLPALHNTTTDDVQLFDTDVLPSRRQDELQALRSWLAQAGHRARAERAAALGLQALAREPEALARAVRRRANDWAQLRPEWGLANNAAFIIAPRVRSRHLRLDGRCFLHDYDEREDEDGSTLELIMTAPMVVTNWINLQYHASTVDNLRFGSGNKTLHNVVGGHIGVFEGNGGDLRIGLPLQSLHDGQDWRHQPLRLSVFIEAPCERIDAILARHAQVRDLVHHGWLHLLRIDGEARRVEQLRDEQWRTVHAAH